MRHRQTKGAETDRPILPPPRHIPTLPPSVLRRGCLPCPKLGVERKQSGEKRKSPYKVRLQPGYNPAMTSDLDIYRSAQALVKQHGEDAPIHAAMRADAPRVYVL